MGWFHEIRRTGTLSNVNCCCEKRICQAGMVGKTLRASPTSPQAQQLRLIVSLSCGSIGLHAFNAVVPTSGGFVHL